MTVKLEHLGGAVQAIVVRGVDSVEAVTHFCDSLERGGGPTEPIVVLDLTEAPGTAQTMSHALHRTAQTLAQSQRWMGVVEPQHALATHNNGWYRTPAAAVAAGRRYASLITGQRPPAEQLSIVVGGLTGAITWAPEVLAAMLRRGERALRTATTTLRRWV